MDRLRRSLRESFRKKKEHVPECSKPHQWQADEAGVRAGTCNFQVKYLGCVEVFESRGMQVCEEALKMLRNSRRRPVKGVLYVTGDGLRVVDDDTKGLIVDQTIEKVSFCAPDRNHEKGFSYICRDGTSRRWMCHGFLAVKDSGERLSHAVGCAFAACLERKQKRDKECGVTMTFDPNNSTFTRLGSFRQTTLTERLQEAALDGKANMGLSQGFVADQQQPSTGASSAASAAAAAAAAVHNPFAIERPHATPMMLQRQGSFRGFNQLNQTSPFKRQLSLRLSDLPSNLERQQRSMSLESSDFSKPSSPASPQLPLNPRNRLHSLPNAVPVNMSPIPESSPVGDRHPADSISAMCQQLTHGLALMANNDEPFPQPFGPTPSSAPPTMHSSQLTHINTIPSHVTNSRNGPDPIREENPWAPYGRSNSLAGPGPSRAEAWLASTVDSTKRVSTAAQGDSSSAVTKSTSNPVNLLGGHPAVVGNHVGDGKATALPIQPCSPVLAPPRRAPHISHLRSQSLGAQENTSTAASHPHHHYPPPSRLIPRAVFETAATASLHQQSVGPSNWSSVNGNSSSSQPLPPHATAAPFRDPFDAEWAALAARTSSHQQSNTNPFAQNSVKAFEVHM